LQARSFRSWFLLLLLACAGAVACAGPRPPPASPARSTYRIGAPDHLRIKILPDPAIEQDAVVRPDGMISVDLIGDVQATGRTAGQIAAEIENRIARFKRSASVTVSVLNARTNTVVIYREDGRGAAIELAKETRVAEAIAQAGGYSFLSRRAKVRVIRTDGEATEVLRVNLAAIQRGDLRTNYVLSGGDIVIVPPNAFAIVGYAFQAVLFPFQGLLGAAGTALGTAALAAP
jgi:polysaccharide export outer membrane protein